MVELSHLDSDDAMRTVEEPLWQPVGVPRRVGVRSGDSECVADLNYCNSLSTTTSLVTSPRDNSNLRLSEDQRKSNIMPDW